MQERIHFLDLALRAQVHRLVPKVNDEAALNGRVDFIDNLDGLARFRLVRVFKGFVESSLQGRIQSTCGSDDNVDLTPMSAHQFLKVGNDGFGIVQPAVLREHLHQILRHLIHFARAL